MKKLTILILVVVCFSCGRSIETEKDTSFDFSYTVDTVMVDPGDGLVFLRLGLSTTALTPDQKKLYNFNPAASEMEIIDLESLRLSDRIQMEKEGPNGTGRPRQLITSKDGNTFFASFTDVREFDSQLENMKSYKIQGGDFEGLQVDQSLSFDLTISPDGKFVYTPYGSENTDQAREGLAILELQTMKLKTYPMEIWERIHAYIRSFFMDGQMVSRTYEAVYIDPVDDRILISSPNFNEVYILDLETDSISHKTFHSQLTEDSKKVPSVTNFDSPDQIPEIIAESEEQVSFSRFYYDNFNKKFWRFSRDLDRKIGDSAVFKGVVTLFDENLNQLHEEVSSIPFFGFKFFKDGKLYSYVNVEDELGFAVHTFDF
ncbi:DUF4221 family protein [Algoriphagus sp.]|uniref:DUF4221 family protein n=1 Tax=Algoriphagus sp. TaxID=1872435 RepID=UPI003F6F6C65